MRFWKKAKQGGSRPESKNAIAAVPTTPPHGAAGTSSEALVRALVTSLADGTTATEDGLRGLSANELDEIERDQPAPLAAAYACFLRLVGGGAGHFFQGSDVFHPHVIGLREAADELLRENQEPFHLRSSDRVIFMHQGYQFEFLRGEGPDPEVWSYSEGDTEPSRIYIRFTDWLEANVRQQREAWAHLVPWYEAEQQKPSDERRVYFYRHHPDGSVTDEL
ncbi:SMI1/KNR4 family protein [Streptomyces vietnamensis]|uniref:SMI1/KNR4 family protein n=1 Tax=Streptomyces vietnamensis TaxID=362257 RepID=UPI00131CAC6D|nr:SMI1/KNR4 family protein [Streptomyces vietnamensis]